MEINERQNSNSLIKETNPNSLEEADRLYEEVRLLSKDINSTDENTARLIVEKVDDAIKIYGNSNQEKKLELRRIRREAELIIPPETLEDLNKRSQRELLKHTYPKKRFSRNIILTVVALLVVIFLILSASKLLFDKASDEKEKTTPSSTIAGNDNRVGNVSSIGDTNDQQEYLVTGFVTDINGSRISDVKISAVDGSAQTESKIDGMFILKIRGQKGKWVRVQALRIGYKSWDDYVQLPTGDLTIQLEAK